MNWDFGRFMDSPDFDEDIDAVIKAIGKRIEQEENNKPIAKNKLDQMNTAHNKMLKILKGNKVRVSSKLGYPYPSMGCISIIGKEIKIEDPKSFVKTVWLGNNIDVYPKTDGDIQIDVTFHGMKKD